LETNLIVLLKYKNRKFYNKNTKAYSTLAEIATMAPGSYVVFNQANKLNITEEVFFDALLLRARNYNSKGLISNEIYKVLERTAQ
jgi:polyhydroxyalkanoate synthesis regulator protein